MRFTLTVIFLGFLGFSQTLFAADDATKKAGVPKGYFFDAQTKKYFTNGKSNFSIQPTGNSAYLEQIEVSINDGQYEPYLNKLKFEKEGLHTVRFRAVDPVLNWSPVQVFNIYVDLTSPLTKWFWKGETFNQAGQLYVHPTAKLVMTGEDSLSGVGATLIRHSGGAATPISGELSFSKAGPVDLAFYSQDRVGNEEIPKELKFIVDDQAPATKVSLDGSHHRVGSQMFIHYTGQISLDATDVGSGLRKIEYQINNGPIVSYTVPIPVTERQLSLKYRATDNVGNAEAWQTLALFQDSIPPRLAVKEVGNFVNVGGKIYARKGFSLKALAEDPDSGVKTLMISRNGKDYAPTSETSFAFDSVGEYRLNVRAFDNVGNMSEYSPISVVIDDTAPVSQYKFSENAVTRGETVLAGLPNRLELQGQDDGVGLDRIEYSYDGKQFVPLKNPIDLSTWNDNSRTVHYYAVDRLGNKEATKQVKIQVLTKGPIVDLFVESENLPNVPLSKIMNSNNVSQPVSKQKRDAASEGAR